MNKFTHKVANSGEGSRNVSGPGPGPVPVPIPVISGPDDWSWFLVPVISGPDDWSRSRLNFDPGTDPGPVAWLLKYSYKKCTDLQRLSIWSKLNLYKQFVIVLLQFQIKKLSMQFLCCFLITSHCLVLGHGPGSGPVIFLVQALVPFPQYFWSWPRSRSRTKFLVPSHIRSGKGETSYLHVVCWTPFIYPMKFIEYMLETIFFCCVFTLVLVRLNCVTKILCPAILECTSMH